MTTELRTDRISTGPSEELPADWGGIEWITCRGARMHNLKAIDLDLPRDQFIVVTGLSGSGKSSLAFDTLYAEGQRRYIESLSSYARQFLEQMPRPDVERIEGLPPTIAIQQRSTTMGPRSTVGTVTEIYDFLRLLYTRVGEPSCPECGEPIRHQTLEEMIARVKSLPRKSRVVLMAPVIRGRKGHHKDVLERIAKQGFVRVRVDGEIAELDELDALARYKTHDIDAVVDRLIISDAMGDRLVDSMRTALDVGSGVCIALVDNEQEIVFSQRFGCLNCGGGIEELQPHLFSFNSPYGACDRCGGLGYVEDFDVELIVPDPEKTLAEDAIHAFAKWGGRLDTSFRNRLGRWLKLEKIPADVPWKKLRKSVRNLLMTGSEGGPIPPDESVIGVLRNLHESTSSVHVSRRLREYMSRSACPACDGARLNPQALGVRVCGYNIAELTRLSVQDALEVVNGFRFHGIEETVSAPILKEIRQRLSFLMDVGLYYLTLERLSDTLSGGEAQRVRLATQVGSGLTGVCYVLDEPSIGLHHRDNLRLLQTLERLRDGGNTVIVVEHDEMTIRRSDWVLDLGPAAGRMGGEVVFNGPAGDLSQCETSLTADYVAGRRHIPVPESRRTAGKRNRLKVKGVTHHNLKDIEVAFPLGTLICVTGVSGSGKSSLINDVLYNALARRIYGSRVKPGEHKRVTGVGRIDKVLQIDQSPIGRSPRSVPATYTKVFDHIRRVYAQTRDAQIRGFGTSRFSFNVKDGRCPVCEGQGVRKVEMHFLPDMVVECEECHGSRYDRETLDVTLRGKSIADVLAMKVEEAYEFFRNHPSIERMLHTLKEVGLGYITLGQSSTTLSGGEAQRIKLATELGKVATGSTVYILDEPTTGLHLADVVQLLKTLNRLVDMGNTVIVIEHHLDVIKTADHIIDLGPEGGDDGGYVVATGTPEELARCEESHTGRALRDVL